MKGIVFSICLFLATGVFGQQSGAAGVGSVSGRTVFGTEKGDGINHPLVILTSTRDPKVEFQVEGDSNGNFRFEKIPAGRYRLRSGGGFSSISMSGVRTITVRPGENNGIVIVVLIDSTIDEFVTIAAGKSQAPGVVSKTVNVIEGKEMRDRADFTLIDSLRTIPGFRVQQSGGFGRVASIKTRGLRNQDTAILIDGMRFRDASAISGDATSFMSDLTLTSVDEVQILRGSGSSLYGTNAIGGTIDFQTPRAQNGTHGQIGGAVGGLGLGRFRGNLSHGIENNKYEIVSGFSRTAYSKGIDGQDNAGNTGFNIRAFVFPTIRFSIVGSLFVTDAKVRLNSNPDTIGTLPTSTSVITDASPGLNFIPDANDPDSFQRSRSIAGRIGTSYIFDRRFGLSGSYQSLRTRRRNDDGVLGPGFQSAYSSVFDGLINTGDVRVNWTPVSFTSMTAGYEFEAEKFGNDGQTPTGVSSYNVLAKQWSHTFFVLNTTSFANRKLNLTGGFRVQSFALDRPACAPAICPAAFSNLSSPPSAYVADGSVSYYFGKTGTKLRTHVGNGYRVPSLYERFGSYFFLGSFFPLGNPQLKPEKSFAVDGGVDQRFANGKVLITATYFYTEIDDEVSYLPTDDLGAPSYYNFDKHFSRGFEFSGTVRPTRSTDIFASYTFTNGDIRSFTRPTFPVGPVYSRDRKVYGVPDHQFTLTATQRYKRFWVNFDLLSTSDYLAPIFSNTNFSTYIYRFVGNRKADLTSGYTFGFKKEKMTLRLHGTVENLFDQEYYENGFRTAKRTGRIGLAFGF